MGLRSALEVAVERKRQARNRLKSAIETADQANHALSQLSRFARSSDIGNARDHWEVAQSQAGQAHDLAESTDGWSTSEQQALGESLLEQDVGEIERVRSRMADHVEVLSLQFAQVHGEERTLAGASRRALGRLSESIARGLGRASRSRASQELGVAVSSLILGGQMLFELTTLDQGRDLTTWAMGYQDDFERLDEHIARVQDIEGFSPAEFMMELSEQANKLSLEPDAPRPQEWMNR